MRDNFATTPYNETRQQEGRTERWKSNNRQTMRNRSGRQFGDCSKKKM